ncbi:hypothetical protein [Paenibacillus hunanensis]|uniref:hypothetical protein n=1 Tax=Paenibacillus hunanensis TaxID=539262 RepID=UPI00286A5E4E|nr:hypothetical protein [Paenibacillus hunanensis]
MKFVKLSLISRSVWYDREVRGWRQRSKQGENSRLPLSLFGFLEDRSIPAKEDLNCRADSVRFTIGCLCCFSSV